MVYKTQTLILWWNSTHRDWFTKGKLDANFAEFDFSLVSVVKIYSNLQTNPITYKENRWKNNFTCTSLDDGFSSITKLRENFLAKLTARKSTLYCTIPSLPGLPLQELYFTCSQASKIPPMKLLGCYQNLLSWPCACALTTNLAQWRVHTSVLQQNLNSNTFLLPKCFVYTGLHGDSIRER